MRYIQLGRDEMAPHGTLPDRLPVCDTLRSAPAAPCGWRIVPTIKVQQEKADG